MEKYNEIQFTKNKMDLNIRYKNTDTGIIRDLFINALKRYEGFLFA